MGKESIFLSYPWGPSCPPYGGGERISLNSKNQQSQGHSCNSLRFLADNHIGTHFDFPLHFSSQGKHCLDFSAEFFIHSKIAFFSAQIGKGDLISPELLLPMLNNQPPLATLAILHTGACLYRDQDTFWNNGPGIDIGVADFLREKFPKLTTVAIDSISISSFKHREKGRVVHREFLCDPKRPLVLIEDMNTAPLLNFTLEEIIALPLRIENADGAPCTVVAVGGKCG